ncbi:hypothetical protein HDV03_002062 [Kappamyces sp. JEL0829]|nr:hypothetical protein HDV03_002062 [Kappamyces sp. JEL0829]
MFKNDDAVKSSAYWDLLIKLLAEGKVPEKPILPLILRGLGAAASGDNGQFLPLLQQTFNMVSSLKGHSISIDQILSFTASMVVDCPAHYHSFLAAVLAFSIQQQCLCSNQKKIFTFATQKLFGPLTKLAKSHPNDFAELYHEFLFKIVFCAEHVLEFGFLLQDWTNISKKKSEIQPYPKLFFEAIKAIGYDMVEFLPKILELFTKRIRSRDIKEYEKTCFQLYQTLQSFLMTLLEGESDLDKTEAIVLTGSQLLRVLYTQSLYRPGNDDVSKAQSLVLLDHYHVLKRLSDTSSLLVAVYRGMDALLSLDFPLMSEHTGFLCRLVLVDDLASQPDAIALAAQLLRLHVKSREVPLLFQGFFQVLHEQDLLGTDTVLTDDRFLQHFNLCLSGMLPSQAMDVIVFFSQEINPVAAGQPKKPKYTRQSIRIASTLLVNALVHAQVNDARRDTLDAFLVDFYNNHTKKVLDAFPSKDKKEQKKDIRKLIVPCLEIHCVSLQLSAVYWKSVVESGHLLESFRVYSPFFERYPMLNVVLLEIACYHLDKLVCHTEIKDGDGRISALVDAIWSSTQTGAKQMVVLQTHIWTLCHLSKPAHIKAFLLSWIDLLAESFGSESLLFNFAPFFEIKAVRELFMHCFLSKLAETIKGSCPELAKLFKSLRDNPKPVLDKLFQTEKDYVSKQQLADSELTKCANLLKAIQVLPVAYLGSSEQETMQSVMHLLERYLAGSFGTSEIAMKAGATCRVLTWRYISSQENTIVTLNNTSILDWMLASQALYTNLSASDADHVLVSTNKILALSLKKAFERVGQTLPKNKSQSPEEYIAAAVALVRNHHKAGTIDITTLVAFWQPITWVLEHDRYALDANGSDIFNVELLKSVRKKIAKLCDANLECLELHRPEVASLVDQLLLYSSLACPEQTAVVLARAEESLATPKGNRLQMVALLLKWQSSRNLVREKLSAWFKEILAGSKGKTAVLMIEIDLESVLVSVLAKCSVEEYQHIIRLLLQEMQNSVAPDAVIAEKDVAVLRTVQLLIQHPHHCSKRTLLYANWPLMVTLLSSLTLSCPSMDVANAIFSLATFVATDKVCLAGLF